MRVRLLGTGSADGWPNPFCRCPSCEAERSAGRSRRPSAALIDGSILVDAGPTAPHLPAGLDLADVEHILLTHGHPDHLHPALLLSREWTHPTRALHVWGPAGAIELCRDWVAPDSTVEFHVVTPGGRLALATADGPATALVLSARHGHGNGDGLADEAVLYLITGADGASLLYATDTGPFDPATCGLPAEPVDVICLDATFGDTLDHGTGHLDLATLPVLVDALRTHGTAGPATRIVATHLSHHNPPTDALRQRLSPLGVEVLDDLSVIDTAGSGATATLILGGARSGKSAHAEPLLRAAPHVTYVATGGTRDDDPEWRARIEAHRRRRPATWTTLETTDLVGALDTATGPVLIDCLALWLTALLDARDAWRRLDAGEWSELLNEVQPTIGALVDAVRRRRADVVLVSNEVGMGVVPATASGRLFQDLLGHVNRVVADACDDVLLMVAGRPLTLDHAGVRP